MAEKEGREAAGFESSFKESSGVKRLEQSVSRFDTQVAKANLVPGKGYNSCVLCWGSTDHRFVKKAAPAHILVL